jgi:hypothetical protein
MRVSSLLRRRELAALLGVVVVTASVVLLGPNVGDRLSEADMARVVGSSREREGCEEFWDVTTCFGPIYGCAIPVNGDQDCPRSADDYARTAFQNTSVDVTNSLGASPDHFFLCLRHHLSCPNPDPIPDNYANTDASPPACEPCPGVECRRCVPGLVDLVHEWVEDCEYP